MDVPAERRVSYGLAWNASTTALAPEDCATAKPSLIQAILAAFRSKNSAADLGSTDSKPLLEPGKGFDSKTLYVGPGGVPGEKAGTYWFYYVGARAAHDENVPTKVKSDEFKPL